MPAEIAALNALDDAIPLITSPAQALAQVGVPFTWPILGPGAATYSASGLPQALSIGSASGVIAGTPMLPGVFDSSITASNQNGIGTQTLRLTVVWPAPTNNLPAGLISWWRGETNANDEMGAHPGTLQGSTGFTNGQSGRAFLLDGVNGSVALGAWFNLQQFTLSLWVKPEATQVEYADILDNNHSGSPNRSWVIQYQNTNTATTSQWGWIVPGRETVPFNLTIGYWQHLVITRDSNYVARVYLNGSLVTTNAGGGTITYDGSQNLVLGRHYSVGRYFNGKVDELMCYNRPLTPNEVAYLYGSQGLLTPPAPPVLQPVTSSPGSFAFGWDATPRCFYQVQSRTNLTTGPWLNLGDPMLGTDGQLSFEHQVSPAEPRRFYRLMVQ